MQFKTLITLLTILNISVNAQVVDDKGVDVNVPVIIDDNGVDVNTSTITSTSIDDRTRTSTLTSTTSRSTSTPINFNSAVNNNIGSFGLASLFAFLMF